MKAKRKKTAKKPAAVQAWLGPDKLKNNLVPIGSVKYDEDNARVHDERNVATIKDSFTTNGQLGLLVVYDGVVRAGNARLKAANELEWTHVAILDVTDWFKSKEQADAFALMDNKSSELATWDFERVASTLEHMTPEWRAFTGFADWEIEPLLAAEFSPPPPGAHDETDSTNPNQKTIVVTGAQFAEMERALLRLRELEEDDSITMGRGLELICADYLSGN